MDGGATMYPPSALVSMPGAILPAEFPRACSGAWNIQCCPPLPVMVVRVSTAPLTSSKVSHLPGPSAFTSRSTATIPDGEPVTIPMLASGHLSHQAVIAAASLLASFRPLGVRGCLAGLLQSVKLQEHLPTAVRVCKGNTGHPRFAWAKAAFFMLGLTVKAGQAFIGLHRHPTLGGRTSPEQAENFG